MFLNYLLSCKEIKPVKVLFKRYFELAFWITSLIMLALMDPSTDAHFSFCFFKFLGLSFCPGCGLGHSISFIFHGNLQASFATHPLGILALFIILFRIYKLSSLHIFNPQKINFNVYR
jgi:hypothetical protein